MEKFWLADRLPELDSGGGLCCMELGNKGISFHIPILKVEALVMFVGRKEQEESDDKWLSKGRIK